MTVFLITFGIILGTIALLAIKIILLPDGEFPGTCSTNNEFFKQNNMSCSVCGKKPGEVCSDTKEK